ncbi:MAG: protein-tyrosine [Bacteroidetes bacterium]|nr:MAG: protein-tyrosine [Bacteroidota bacterium]
MVCLGNICRSPLAEGIMKKKLEDNNIEGFVDSCGFESFHTGDSPDRRGVETALKHGVDISKQKSRLFKVADFDNFDKIYVMDKNNYRDVSAVARNEEDLKKVDLIMNVVHPGSGMPVPDPYYGGASGFNKTWDLLDQATDVIIGQINNKTFLKE